MITVVINGEPKTIPAGKTLAELLAELSLSAGRTACEVNGQLVRRVHYGETKLSEGDAVEILQMIGGG